MFSQNPSPIKYFRKILFCGSLRISLSTDSHADWDKVAYIWIFPNPAKAEPILRGVIVLLLLRKMSLHKFFNCMNCSCLICLLEWSGLWPMEPTCPKFRPSVCCIGFGLQLGLLIWYKS